MSGFALKSPPEKKKVCFWAGLVNRSSPRFVSSLRFCPWVTLVSEITYGNWWWFSFLKVHVQMCTGIRSGVPALIFSALSPPVTTLRLVFFLLLLFYSSFSYCGIVVHLESDLGLTLCFYHLFYSLMILESLNVYKNKKKINFQISSYVKMAHYWQKDHQDVTR